MTGPLHGLKILDFSTLLPGPFGTMMLGDMGSEVTRVVAPGRQGVRPDGPGGQPNPLDQTLNRNKRSIALDMKQPASREVVKRLIERSDVLVEQFRPGVMGRLGWDYPAAKAVNPRIIYASLTGYGQNGPMRDRAGHDINYLALSGVFSYTGRKDGGPAPFGSQVADIAAGSQNLVIGVLAALYHRNATGEGQHVDVSMFDGSVAMNAIAGADFLVTGRTAQRESELLNGGTLYDFYKTKDGEYLSAGGLEPKFLFDFLKALGLSELGQPGDSMFTIKNKAEVKKAAAAAIGKKTLAEWKEVFAGFDACLEPVLDIKGMTEHPQTAARELIVEVESDGRKVRQIAHPIKFSVAPPEYHHAGRGNGAESDAILKEIGYGEKEIAALRESGLMGS